MRRAEVDLVVGDLQLGQRCERRGRHVGRRRRRVALVGVHPSRRLQDDRVPLLVQRAAGGDVLGDGLTGAVVAGDARPRDQRVLDVEADAQRRLVVAAGAPVDQLRRRAQHVEARRVDLHRLEGVALLVRVRVRVRVGVGVRVGVRVRVRVRRGRVSLRALPCKRVKKIPLIIINGNLFKNFPGPQSLAKINRSLLEGAGRQ